MSITKQIFGQTQTGEEVLLYTLANSSGARVSIATYGGSIVSIYVPDKNGVFADVSLGCDNAADYEKQDACLGALIGRFGNRIERGQFTLNGVEYQLYCNDGKNHLHGGKIGYNRRVWGAKVDGEQLVLSLFSPDSEENYPGNLAVTVAYSFSEDNALRIEYNATTDKDTVINLTNHCYFNLAGESSGTVLGHKLRMNCDSFTENSAECLPTGAILPVEGTPLDFREFAEVGARIEEDHIQLENCGGYDHNFIINGGQGMKLAAELWDETSGRLMTTTTTKPGVQLYTGNFLKGNFAGKGGRTYGKRTGLCLETQFFPNAMKCTNFPSPVLKAGEVYHHTTVYKFGLR